MGYNPFVNDNDIYLFLIVMIITYYHSEIYHNIYIYMYTYILIMAALRNCEFYTPLFIHNEMYIYPMINKIINQLFTDCKPKIDRKGVKSLESGKNMRYCG